MFVSPRNPIIGTKIIDHVDVQLQVSDLNFLSLDTHVIFTSITHALMASFAMFPTIIAIIVIFLRVISKSGKHERLIQSYGHHHSLNCSAQELITNCFNNKIQNC